MRRRNTTPEKRRASFIEPMLLQRSAKLPEGAAWLIELKLDGFRAIAFKTNGNVHLRSRHDTDFNSRYPAIVKGLSNLPDETVLDGEIVALDESGRPSFNVLQNYGSSDAPVFYYVFDLLVLAGRDVMTETLDKAPAPARHEGFAQTRRADPALARTQRPHHGSGSFGEDAGP